MSSDDRTRSEGGDTGLSEQVSGVTAGKGRRDEVGHSGVYPADSSDIPADAEIVMPGEVGRVREHPVPGGEATADTGVELDVEQRGDAEGEMLTWTPPPNIVPEGERSDR